MARTPTDNWSGEQLEALRNQGLSYAQIQERTGLSHSQLQNQLYKHRRKRREQEAQQKFPSAEELVRQEKAKLQRQHEQRVLKKLVKEQGRTELMCDAMREAMASLPPAHLPEFTPIETTFDDEHVGLIISDCQVGQVVDPEETGGLGEYNIQVFKRRAKYLTKSVRKITSIHKRAYNLPVLHVFVLGDIVENEVIFRGQKDYIDADVVSQLFVAADELSMMLLELAQDYERVEVYCVGGNHGRTGKKGEGRTWVNWDYIAYQFMAEKLKNQERIRFHIPKSWFMLVGIFDWHFLLMHGDDIKSWNAIPYYGFDRADARWTKLLQARGQKFDYFLIGHHHNQAQIDSPVGEKIVNGCWPGGSQYSLKSLNTANRPSQLFFGIHPRHGITWRYKLNLEREA